MNNQLYYNYQSNDTLLLNLETLESAPTSLHKYIEPETTTNSLVERLKQVVNSPYEVILGRDYPETDAQVLKGDRSLMNVSVFENELWINLYDSSDETFQVVADIMKNYETSINKETVIQSMKDTLNETVAVDLESGEMSYSVWPTIDDSDPVRLVVVAQLK